MGDVYERGRKMRSLKANSKGRGGLGEVGTKGLKRDRRNDGKEYKIWGDATYKTRYRTKVHGPTYSAIYTSEG